MKNTLDKPRIAIFYDWLNTWGGAERLLQNMLAVFPTANLYTTAYSEQDTTWLPENIKINCLKIPKFFNHRLTLLAPLIPALLEKMNFDEFDIVISLGTTFNNCLLTKPSTRYLSYILTPNRYLYNDRYHIPSIFKKMDYVYAQRPDIMLTISQTVANRINNVYHRNSIILYPGVDTKFFCLPTSTENKTYFLCVSRLVPHKNLDLAIHACGLAKQKLIIVGNGRHKNYLLEQANKYSNIYFYENVSDLKLKKLYQKAIGVISPQVEDFGLVNLEAMACGTPVLALATDGNTETILNKKTGLFFEEASVNCLVEKIYEFINTKFLPLDCRIQAKKFSLDNFVLNLKNIIHEAGQTATTH